MGKKYIIEKDDNESIWSIYADADGDATIEGVSLTPYTEPEPLAEVTADAYQRGYETAKHECEDCTKQAYTDALRMESYQKGLSDAWEAARKISQVRKYGGYGDCLEEVFGRHRVPWDVFDYSASEAIAKIQAYEQEKEEGSRLRRSIKNVMSACDCSLDDIAEALQKMKKS